MLRRRPHAALPDAYRSLEGPAPRWHPAARGARVLHQHQHAAQAAGALDANSLQHDIFLSTFSQNRPSILVRVVALASTSLHTWSLLGSTAGSTPEVPHCQMVGCSTDVIFLPLTFPIPAGRRCPCVWSVRHCRTRVYRPWGRGHVPGWEAGTCTSGTVVLAFAQVITIAA